MLRKLFFLMSLFLYSNGSESRLLFKFPTRDRVRKFFYCLDQYYKLMSHKHPYFFMITCDDNDKSMNSKEVRARLAKYENLEVYYGDSKSKIHACNRDMEWAPAYDILILVSDDMIPIKQNYDEIIVQEMLNNFPDYDGVLNFNGTVNGGNLNTLAMLGRKFYERFNYIYHPIYKSFFCDLEMSIVSKILKKEAVIYNLIIEHQNPAFGKVKADRLFKKNHFYWHDDLKAFNKRLKKKFDFPLLSDSDHQLIKNLIG